MKKQYFTKAMVLSILLCFTNLLSNAQSPAIKWQKTKGGTEYESVNSILKLNEGNFLIVGSTASPFPNTHGGNDAFASKINASGQTIWTKYFGGTGDDAFNDVIQNSNGSFTIAGRTGSNDGNVNGNHGGDYDGWVVNLSTSGNLLWQKCYGGSGDDEITSITKSNNNNFVFAGFTNSNDGDVNNNHGDYDGWIVKSNSNSNLLWSKCIGGSGYDDLLGIDKTTGTTYVATGGTDSYDGDITGNHGGDDDIYAIKINDAGNIMWQKCYGGSDLEFSNASTILNDGNICFTGPTISNDGDVTGFHGGHNDAWTVKINQSNGAIIWQTCNGDALHGTAGFGLTAASDGGVLVGGETGIHDDWPTLNARAFKLDANGNTQWSMNFGGSQLDISFSGIELNNGDFILNCYTESDDGDVTNQHGNGDGWIVRITAQGNCRNGNYPDKDIETSEVNVFPNPISNSATISFTFSQSENVSLNIYDINGSLRATLADGVFESGEHKIEFNAEKLDAGIYFLKMSAGSPSEQAGEYLKMKKLVVTK